MSWKEYKELMVQEWEFHKRHPEMFIVWGILVLSSVKAISSLFE